MKIPMKRTFIAVGLIIALSACNEKSAGSSQVAIRPAKPKTARIIAITDLHGALETDELLTANKQVVRSGGAALLAAYIRRARDAFPGPTFILDAGDLFQGTLVSNTVEGRPVIDFYNVLGVDAATIGNHEFDFGPEGPNSVPRAPSEDPRGALKERIRQAKFPFLAANIRHKDGSTPDWARPSVLIERGGVKVGVVGIAAVDTQRTTLLRNVEDLEFLEATQPIVSEAARLRAQGADYVVVITHTGGECKDNSEAAQRDLSSCTADSEIAKLVRALPSGTIDLAIGGHTHKTIVKFMGSTPVLQSSSNSRAITWADLGGPSGPLIKGPYFTCGEVVPSPRGPTCDPNVVKVSTVTTPPAAQFLGAAIAPDAQIEELLAPEFSRVRQIKEAPIGVTTLAEFRKDYFEENAVGNLVADAYHRHFVGNPDGEPQVVLVNNGGLRFNIPAGALNYGHIFTVLPFDNKLATMKMTGATLIKAIESGISRKSGGISWSGLSFEAESCKVLSAQVGAAAIDEAKTYVVLAPDFIATGDFARGLGIPASDVHVFEELPVMRDVAIEALKALPSPLAPEQYYEPSKPRQRIRKICE